jgi:hypothetical protein
VKLTLTKTSILGTSAAKVATYKVLNMKTTASLLTLILGIAVPALSAWLLSDQTFSPEILCGSYSIAGLLFIAVADYSPRRILTLPNTTASATARRTRLSPSRSSRFRRSLRADKILS